MKKKAAVLSYILRFCKSLCLHAQICKYELYPSNRPGRDAVLVAVRRVMWRCSRVPTG